MLSSPCKCIPSHQYPDPKASVTFLVAGLASTVPHILVRLHVGYDGIQTEENRLQSKNKSNWGFSKFVIPLLKI